MYLSLKSTTRDISSNAHGRRGIKGDRSLTEPQVAGKSRLLAACGNSRVRNLYRLWVIWPYHQYLDQGVPGCYIGPDLGLEDVQNVPPVARNRSNYNLDLVSSVKTITPEY